MPVRIRKGATMKSKRFTFLIALLSVIALSVSALFGTTAVFAEDTAAKTDASEYFVVENDEAEFAINDADKIKVTLKKEGEVVVKTKYAVAKGTTFVWNGAAAVTSSADENGVRSFTFAATVNAEYTLESVTVSGKNLYTVTNGVLTANEDAIVTSIKFDDYSKVIFGYKYSDVTFDAYQPFIANLGDYKKVLEVGSGDYRRVYNVTSKDAVKFLEKGNQTVKGYIFEGEYSAEDWATAAKAQAKLVLDKSYDVTDEKIEEAPAYTSALNTFDYTAYQKKIEEATKTDGQYKYVSSSTYFNVPEDIYSCISSNYFAKEDLTFEIYYKLPGSTTFTHLSSTSSIKRFALSKIGYYEYYVLATDPQKNSLELDSEWKLEINSGKMGFYSEESGDKKLEVPVFSFYMGNNGPQVDTSSSTQDPGFVGSTYTGVSSFTVKGNDVTTEYSLWYNANENLSETPDASGEGWVEISDKDVFAETFADLKYEDLGWSSSALSFKPLKIGSYVVKCKVADAEAHADEAFTKVINVKTEVKKVSIDTTSVWFEKNWKSVLFLGIAGLSLIGIIVLLFVKPKEEDDLIVKKS